MKRTSTSLAASVLAAFITLGAATPAWAADLPYGSVPYGPNTICEGNELMDPSAMQCAPLPVAAWSDGDIPTGTPIDAPFERIAFIHAVAAEDSYLSSLGDHAYERSFFVAPSDVTSLPLPVTATFTPTVPLDNVTGIFVVTAPENDPFGLFHSGTTDQTTAVGLTVPVTITDNGDGTYTADMVLPTPTYLRATDGVLNGIGYNGVLYITGETEADLIGIAATGINIFSPAMDDLLHFSPDIVVTDPSMGVVGTGSYMLALTQFLVPLDGEVPSVPEPVAPPAPPAPVVPPAAEPPYPMVNTGDDSGDGFALVLLAVAAVTAPAGAIILRRSASDDPA